MLEGSAKTGGLGRGRYKIGAPGAFKAASAALPAPGAPAVGSLVGSPPTKQDGGRFSPLGLVAAPCPLAGIWMNSKGIFNSSRFQKNFARRGFAPAPDLSLCASFFIRSSLSHAAPVTSSLPSLRSVADSVPVAPRHAV